MPSSPSPRPLKVTFRTLAVCLLVGAAAWLAADAPRRIVAAAVADRLSAEVRLEGLEILARDVFVLSGLEITRAGDPAFVDRLFVAELLVEGRLADLRAGRYRRLRFSGVEARLVPAPVERTLDQPPSIGELILEPATVRIATAGREDARLTIEATLRGIGHRTSGRVRLRAPDLGVGPVVALLRPGSPPPVGGRARDLSAELRLGLRGAEVDARAAAVELSREARALELLGPRLEVAPAEEKTRVALTAAGARLTLGGETARADALRLEALLTPPAATGRPWRFEARPELDWLRGGVLTGAWDAEERRLLGLDGRLEGLELARLAPAWGIDATADLELHGAGDRLEWSAEAAPRRFRAAADRSLEMAPGSELAAAGSLPFEPLATLAAPVWDGPVRASLFLPAAEGRWGEMRLAASLLPLRARFAGRWQGPEPLTFDGDARFDTALDGLLTVSGRLVGGDEPRLDTTWKWTGGRLDRPVSWLRRKGLILPPSVTGVITASGDLRGPWAQPALGGETRLLQVGAAGERGSGDAPAWSLDGGEARARWTWPGGDRPVRLASLTAAGTLRAPGVRPLPVTLTDAAGRGRLDGSRGVLETATVTSPGLGTARLAGAWRRPRDVGVEAAGTLALQGLDLAAWRSATPSLASHPALAGLELAGTAEAELTLERDPDGAWRVDGPARLHRGGFASADGGRVLEGLEGRFDVRVRGDPEASIRADAEGRAGGFVLLWDTFFGDFSAFEASISAGAERGPPAAEAPSPWRIESRVELPGGPVVETSLGKASTQAALAYEVAVRDGDLAATRERYLAVLSGGPLDGVDFGGAVELRGRGHLRAGDDGPADWDMIGALELTGFRLANAGGQAAIGGLDLELPFDLRRRPAGDAAYSGPRLGGRMAFDRLALRGLELPPTATDLRIEADSVGLEKPIALAVLGGTATLERLTAKHVLRPGRHLEAGLELSGLRLERIAEALGLFPLEGALDGRFPLARLSSDLLEVEGGGRVEVFGGSVEVRDVSGKDVLSPYPEITLSADFRGVDLGALTRRLDFGEMTGILEGSIEDCRLFRGVPVDCSARFATTEVDGVPRTVDVKAVNNLSILGTGRGTNAFDRGIRSFLKRYRYARLGVTVELRGDVLLMRGLERRGDKELFLRGRFPFRIDVVNAQPGRTVSFQAMVRRLKSLDFARATMER